MSGASRSFGKTQVLADVSAEIRAGEVVGIIGPNGGGKSTLLLMIAGLLRPTDGSVTVTGIPAHELAGQSAGVVGLVTARPGLYPLLTGAENLHYFASLFELSDDEIAKRSAPLLELFGLSDAMETRLSTWSTGMQQRLSLVRALITEPRLLLFDEPTANLDPPGELELHRELRRQADRGRACVLVTHRLEQAQTVCDRAWFVDGGIRGEASLEPGAFEPPKGPLYEMWQEAR